MRACVCGGGGGFLDISVAAIFSVAGVRLKRIHSFHIKAKPESILYIFYTGRSSSVGSV